MATKRPLSEVYDFEDGDENSENFLDDSLVKKWWNIFNITVLPRCHLP